AEMPAEVRTGGTSCSRPSRDHTGPPLSISSVLSSAAPKRERARALPRHAPRRMRPRERRIDPFQRGGRSTSRASPPRAGRMARSAIGIRRGSPRGVDRHDLWCAEGARVDTQVVNLTVERGIGRELRAAEPVAGRCAEVGRPERQAGVGRDGRAIDVERSAARAEYDRDVRPGADGQDCGSVEALFAGAAVAAGGDREPRDVTAPVVGREKHVDVRAAAEVEDALPAVVCADVYPDRDGHARQRLEQRARKRDVVTRGAREIEVVADDAGRERRRAGERSIVAVSGGVWDRRTGRLIEGVVGEERREALAPGAARPWSSRRASGATRARAAGATRTRATNAAGVGLTAAAAGVRASGATHARAAGADHAARPPRPATTCSGLTARAAGARA